MTCWLHQPRRATVLSNASFSMLSGNYYRVSKNTYVTCQHQAHSLKYSKTNVFRISGGIRMIPQLLILIKFKLLLHSVFWETQAFSPSWNEVKTPSRSVLLMPWAEHNITCQPINVEVILSTHQSARLPLSLTPCVGQATSTQAQRTLVSLSDSDLHLLNHNNETNKI